MTDKIAAIISNHHKRKFLGTRPFLHHCIPSTIAVSSKVCNQLKIIIFRSYFESGLPLSLSTSRSVRGKLLVALCLATLRTAAFVLFIVVVLLVVEWQVPGTVSLAVPVVVHSVLTLAAAVDGATSILSRLNSLCDSLSRALYVVSSLRRM